MLDTLELVIITGMSGAGKTVAVQSFEDLGYYCVDNMPPNLLPTFWELLKESGKITRIALVIDLRSREFFSELENVIARMDNTQFITTRILFLDASDKALVSRYKETRRNHPLATDGRLMDDRTKQPRGLHLRGGQAREIERHNPVHIRHEHQRQHEHRPAHAADLEEGIILGGSKAKELADSGLHRTGVIENIGIDKSREIGRHGERQEKRPAEKASAREITARNKPRTGQSPNKGQQAHANDKNQAVLHISAKHGISEVPENR